MRLLPLLALVGAAFGCSTVDVVEREPKPGPEPEPEPRPAVCGGAITSTATVVATDLAFESGWLRGAGETVFFGDRTSARLRAIDLCSGAVDDVATLEELGGGAVIGDAIYFTGTAGGAPGLYRWSRAVPELERVMDLRGPGQLATTSDRLFVLLAREEKEPNDTPDLDIYEIDPSTPALLPRHVVEAWAPGTTTSLVGASPAGLYVRQSYDCGCNPKLVLYPLDGKEASSLADTEGSVSLAVVGDRIVVAADLESLSFGESDLDIVSLPLAGGEPEVLLEKDEEHTRDVFNVVADERSVCFLPYGSGPRCLDASSGSLRVVDDPAEWTATGPLVMTGGAIAWLRKGAEGFDLVAAVP